MTEITKIQEHQIDRLVNEWRRHLPIELVEDLDHDLRELLKGPPSYKSEIIGWDGDGLYTKVEPDFPGDVVWTKVAENYVDAAFAIRTGRNPFWIEEEDLD